MHLFTAITNHEFSENVCFLCGEALTLDNRADEHVIPKWIQGKYELWDQQIHLLNGTLIPYRQLTIPCCNECNNVALSQIESKVRLAVEEGFDAVVALDPQTLFIWLGKIFYGMLYRELFLLMDRRSPNLGSIMSSEHMERYQMHHYFLQSCRVPMELESADAAYPWTIYIFPIQETDDCKAGWDFRDDIVNDALFIRLGGIGMLAAFDAGAIAVDSGVSFSRYSEYKLHPLQFEELGAAFFYKASLLDRIPKYVVSERDKQCKVLVLPIAGLSSKPVFREWDMSSYAQMLSIFTGAPLPQLMPEPEKVVTWLRQANGEFLYLDVKDNLYRGYHPAPEH